MITKLQKVKIIGECYSTESETKNASDELIAKEEKDQRNIEYYSKQTLIGRLSYSTSVLNSWFYTLVCLLYSSRLFTAMLFDK